MHRASFPYVRWSSLLLPFDVVCNERHTKRNRTTQVPLCGMGDTHERHAAPNSRDQRADRVYVTDSVPQEEVSPTCPLYQKHHRAATASMDNPQECHVAPEEAPEQASHRGTVDRKLQFLFAWGSDGPAPARTQPRFLPNCAQTDDGCNASQFEVPVHIMALKGYPWFREVSP